MLLPLKKEKIQVPKLRVGDIVAVSGIENVRIGDTISSDENPMPLPRIKIDEPTISMLFYVNKYGFQPLRAVFIIKIF